MADINIANLPDSPLPILDGDFIHTSQSGTDFKIVMTDLADRFNLVDIFGLTQSTTPASGNFVPISTSGTIDGNRRVSLFNMGKLYQANEFFVSSGSIVLTDETLWRDGGIETLEQTTFQEVRDLTLNMNVGFSGHPVPLTTDRYMVFDSVATQAKFITGISLQGEMTDPSNFSALPSAPVAADAFIIREDSTNLSRSITFSSLESAIAGSVDTSNFVTLTTNQTNISGTKTFTSATGIKTDKIVEATSNVGVTIEGVRCENNSIEAVVNVEATGFVSGKFIGSGGSTVSRFIEIDSSNIIIKTTGTMRPDITGVTSLGNSSFKWENGFFDDFNTTNIDVVTRADLPLNGTFIGSTNLIDSGVIRKSLLPIAGGDVVGIVLFANSDEAKAGTSSTRGLTPSNLFDIVISDQIFITASNGKQMDGTVRGFNFEDFFYISGQLTFSDDSGAEPFSVDIDISAQVGSSTSTDNYSVVTSAISSGTGADPAVPFWDKDNSTGTTARIVIGTGAGFAKGLTFVITGLGI